MQFKEQEISGEKARITFSSNKHARRVAAKLADNAIPFKLKTEIFDSSIEWEFSLPTHAIGLIRSLKGD